MTSTGRRVFRRDPLATDEDLIEAVTLQMNPIERDPALVRAFFGRTAVADVNDTLMW